MKRPGIRAVLLSVFLAAGLAGPYVAPYGPEEINLRRQFEGPSPVHLLGTADNGIDLLSALLHGARLALVVGTSVTLVCLTIGTLLGLLAGFSGGALDHAVTGLADTFQAFPAIILHAAILALVDQPSLTHLVLALSLSGWVLYARLVRAEVLSLRERDFVLAARALGASPTRLVFRHLLPHAKGPLLVQATAGFGATVLSEANLSFLGLGPGTSVSWGALLEQGSGVLLVSPHVILITGAVIAMTVLAFNLERPSRRLHVAPRFRPFRGTRSLPPPGGLLRGP